MTTILGIDFKFVFRIIRETQYLWSPSFNEVNTLEEWIPHGGVVETHILTD